LRYAQKFVIISVHVLVLVDIFEKVPGVGAYSNIESGRTNKTEEFYKRGEET
jgi:hypothetical protein